MTEEDEEFARIEREASVNAWLRSPEMTAKLERYAELLKERGLNPYTYVERRCPRHLEDAMHKAIDDFLEQHGYNKDY